MSVRLIVLNGREKGREIPLPSSQFIIGRKSECHLRPHSEKVSKLHCGIGRAAGRLVVRDFNSRNGTFINEQPVQGSAPVNDGDILRVGPYQFRFAIDVSSESEVQLVEKSDVDWLLEPQEAAMLDSKCETEVLAVPSDEMLDANETWQAKADDVPTGLSAGNYLKKKVSGSNGDKP